MRTSRAALALLIASLVGAAWLVRRERVDPPVTLASSRPAAPEALSVEETEAFEPAPEAPAAETGNAEPDARVSAEPSSASERAALSVPPPAPQSVPGPEAQPGPEAPLQSQPAPEPVPLEKLLGHKPEYRRPERGLVLEEPPAPQDPAQGATPGARSPIEVRHRSQEVGPMGPDRRTVGDAEVGVSVPVDDAVSVKGGVRVDYDQDPKKERTQIDSTPTVGVEVRF